MCKPANALTFTQSCPKPRRSKLKPRRSKLLRLQRLQKKTRARQAARAPPLHHVVVTPAEKIADKVAPAEKAFEKAAQVVEKAEKVVVKPAVVEKTEVKDKRKIEVPLAKRPKVSNDDDATTKDTSSPTASSAPSDMVWKSDTGSFVSAASAAATLREELHLRVEDDPYGDCPAPVRTFAELTALPRHVLCSLQRHGITAPLPIQAQALPLVLQGRDVIGLAQTGSGKTLAFLLPASVFIERHRLSNPKWPRVPSPFALVLAPTRELAVQIADEANKVFDGQGGEKSNRVNTVALYGGEDKFQQKKRLGWGADIVVATPGRLSDFINTNVVSMDRVAYFVLDEADRMLDMGFQDEVADIAKKLRPERQILFFSATWNKEVQQLAQGLCKGGSKAVRISYGQEADASDGTAAKAKAREGIIQQVVVVDHPNHNASDHWEKQEAEKEVIMEKHLKSVLTASEEHKVLVFVSQKLLADKLSTRLQKLGFKADSMHGGKSQDYRLWVLDQFRKGELRLLVCTDVLGRGIDIPSVSHVVIHEMGEVEDYIHRIGRTARGQYGKGHALVFFEYWDGSPTIAAELMDVLAASKQPVPDGLRTIADEVASGKRKSRVEGSGNWRTSFVPKYGSKSNASGK